MIRLYLDFDSIINALIEEGELEEGATSKDLDIVSFNIYEASSSGGSFTLIDNVEFNPQVSYLETTKETSDTHWFKVSYIDSASPAVESELSDAFLAENIYNVISKTAVALGDISRDSEETMAFTDEEYILKIKEALQYHNGSKSLAGLEEGDISMIILLVRISCCYDLAYDNAKYTQISLPDGISLNKGERVEHYLNIAKQLEERYEKMKEGWTDEDGGIVGTPTVEVTEFTRKRYFDTTRFRGEF